MSSLPAPLDNMFVLIAVIIGLIVLTYAVGHSRKTKRQLEQTRANKEAAKQARLKAKREAAESDDTL